MSRAGRPRGVVVMGVSGAGKTRIGRLLARTIRARFIDADRYHSATSRRRMAAGRPLTEAARRPWLRRTAAAFRAALRGGPAVLACSALKERHRAVLARAGAEAFVFLKVSRRIAERRVRGRRGHFFPAALVESQFAALERPRGAFRVDAGLSPAQVLGTIVRGLGGRRERRRRRNGAPSGRTRRRPPAKPTKG